MSKPIYLDYNATCPCDPRVVTAMMNSYSDTIGNASSSTHLYGWTAQHHVKKSREAVAELIGAKESQILFNSGATEANNAILTAVAQHYQNEGCHIITSQIEHKCILQCCSYLESLGCELSYLPVNSDGHICLDHLDQYLRPNTRLLSIMAANNETGVIQNIDLCSKWAKKHGILFHTDAAQLIGKVPFNIQHFSIDFMSFSSHKFYGPKGIGAIYAKDFSLLIEHPFIWGGTQEYGARSGTLNVQGIVGFAEAARIAKAELSDESKRISRMKESFVSMIHKSIPNLIYNGNITDTLPGSLNFYIPNIASKDLLSLLRRDLAISTGSACTSATQEPSHVLRAMGLSDEECKSSLRLSFGRYTREEDLEDVVRYLVNALQKLSPSHYNNRKCA
ncbi:MAG: cysteine desulfurase [Waddliaceae bacterium]|nr:cysteine desulfurase [Waddliaceae bacterium]